MKINLIRKIYPSISIYVCLK